MDHRNIMPVLPGTIYYIKGGGFSLVTRYVQPPDTFCFSGDFRKYRHTHPLNSAVPDFVFLLYGVVYPA